MNCPLNHRPRETAPGLNLCHTCRDQLEQHIAELPALDHDLETALTHTDQRPNDPIRHRPDPGLTLNLTALEARTAIRQQLNATTRMIIDERHLTTHPQPNVPALATFVTRHADWLAAHEEAQTWANEYAQLHSQARRAAHPTGTRRIALAPCIEPDCQGTLHAHLRPADDILPSTISCDGTQPHTYEPHDWIALGRRIRATGHAQLASLLDNAG